MDTKNPIEYRIPRYITRPAYAQRKPGFVRVHVSEGMLQQRHANTWHNLGDHQNNSSTVTHAQQRLAQRPELLRHPIKIPLTVSKLQAVAEKSVSTPELTHKPQFRLRRIVPKLVTSLAAFLIISGLGTLTVSLKNNHTVGQQARALADSSVIIENTANGVSSSSTDIPTEDKPSESVVSQYVVAAQYPKYLQSAKLGGYKSRVLRVGLTDDGAVAAPRSVWDAGWYDGSSTPHDKIGASLIVGHVAGPTTSGIFYNLHKLTAGDEIVITMGDDTAKTYEVVAQEEVLAENMNMNKYLVSKNIDKPGLNLVTCSGDFDPKTNTYNKRTIVYAVVKG